MKKIVTISLLVSFLFACTSVMQPITPATYNEALISAQSQYTAVASSLEKSVRLRRFTEDQERIILKAMQDADNYLDLAELAAEVDEEEDGMEYLDAAMNILIIMERELKQ